MFSNYFFHIFLIFLYLLQFIYWNSWDDSVNFFFLSLLFPLHFSFFSRCNIPAALSLHLSIDFFKLFLLSFWIYESSFLFFECFLLRHPILVSLIQYLLSENISYTFGNSLHYLYIFWISLFCLFWSLSLCWMACLRCLMTLFIFKNEALKGPLDSLS